MKKIALLFCMFCVVLTSACSIYNENNTDDEPSISNVQNESSKSEEQTEEEIQQTNELFVYENDGKSVAILKYIGADNYIEIPDEINDVPVEKIATGAFTNDTSIVKVKKTLNKDDCEDINNVNNVVFLPDSIDIIEENVFDEKTIFISNATEKKRGLEGSKYKGKRNHWKRRWGKCIFFI